MENAIRDLNEHYIGDDVHAGSWLKHLTVIQVVYFLLKKVL